MIHYILLSITIVLFGVFAFIKLRYPFWNIQPVFHKYDYWRYFYTTPFIIQKYRPMKTKFCDFTNIITKDYLELSDNDKRDVCDILQCYYIPSEQIIHNISVEDIDAALTGQIETSYVSIYTEPEYKAVSKPGENADIITIKKPIGAICSHYLNFYYREPTNKDKPVESSCYFIDYLSVDRNKNDSTNKLACRKLLQTHEHKQRLRNPKVLVSLIKKEVELFDGIIPLVEFKTYTFNMRNIHFPPLPAHFEVLEINSENIDILLDFLFIQKNMVETSPFAFDVMTIPDVGNLIAIIKRRLLYVFCLRNGEEIYGFYFIRDQKRQYENPDNDSEINSLVCAASIANSDSLELFYLGYLHGLRQIIKRNVSYKIISIEAVGHNKYLLNKWLTKHSPIRVSETAYYLYNMVYPQCPVDTEKCLFI